MNFKKKIPEMRQMREKCLAERKTDSISVHKLLIKRALPLLCGIVPECENFYAPLLDTLIGNVCKPDCSGDREKGLGKHYYCSVNFLGMKQEPVGGYLKNGCMRFSPSAGTMLEEDYTMAVTMFMAGLKERSAEFLARAIHMISDICCLPHALGMTYFSLRKSLHQAYEDLAKSMYTDFVPEQELSEEQLHIFDGCVGFSAVLNEIVKVQRPEVEELLGDTRGTIIKRLYAAELHVAALMYKFYNDTVKAPEKAAYIRDGAEVIADGSVRFTAKISEQGITLLEDEKVFSSELGKGVNCRYFFAGCRVGGKFTFSPVDDLKKRVVSSDSKKLINFDPRKEKCFFGIK